MRKGTAANCVDAFPVEAHLDDLLRYTTAANVATLTGLSTATVSKITSRRAQLVAEETATAILAVKPGPHLPPRTRNDYEIQAAGPWINHGACNGCDPDLFFPERGDNEGVNQAKKICAGCPVRHACLEYALANGEKHGIWGGLSERERRRLRRQRHADRQPRQFQVAS